MREKDVVVFAKEKYGLDEVVSFLKDNFRCVYVFKGKNGDVFPKEAYGRNYDICVSYMSPWIISQKLLNEIREFSINFHPGSPEYRGIGCTNFAIYNREDSYGVTAHLMDSKVDSGRIISAKYFSILPGDSLVDLTQKCYRHILGQFYEVFNYYLKQGSLPVTNEKWGNHLYTRKELNELCRIQEGMTLDEVKRRIRATNFPNMPKAYIELFGHRFEYKE